MASLPVAKTLYRHFGDDQIVTMAKLVIETAFQPIADVSTGSVFGYETLMRGFERLGYKSPLELLDHAHEAGQLFALEQMITGRAFAAFANLPDFSRRTLFVNFDSRLVGNSLSIIDKLASHLQRTGIPPSSICFEISERFDNGAMPEFEALVTRIRLAGFKLAIDDFGAGYSGLKLLCDMPADYLKIDRHFITGIDSDQRRRHLVKQMVQMAHGLGTRVIAEGVETEAEFTTSRDLGCDLVQGWFVARPTVCHGELVPVYPHLETSGKARRQIATLDSMLIRKEIEQVQTLNENDQIDAVFQLFRKSPKRSFFPVLNASGEPRGVINEYHVKELIYHPFGRDLLKNQFYHRRISHFVSAAPIADINTPADEMLSIFASVSGSDCVIVTENLLYAGVLSAASLLKIINEKQLQMAQDQNPLTGLPGNRSIRDQVYDAVLDGDTIRHFCYCDFDNFKPFNDKYGFQKGDMAITLFAGLLRRHLIGDGIFIGHVGGDDFYVGMSGLDAETVKSRLMELIAEFSREVHALYLPEHRAAGYITGHDREGAARHFPLMRCSIAVMTLPKGIICADPQLVSARIADLKSLAKEDPDGLVMHRCETALCA